MEDRVLGAIWDGTTGFSDLVDSLDARAGEVFLTCRTLEREGCLERTGPLVFRLTEEGRERVDREPAPDTPEDGGPVAGEGLPEEGAEDPGDDAPEPAETGVRGFDFRSAYRDVREGGHSTDADR